ncbi:hypothetical protein [Wolbachia endosymbiont (group A) of Agelastica alni]|uniref:hypothetical protein n=1 Tax=Wolbachia endosymbiont (group A) of Agelastica alni TaxID=3066130 RepID=UPI00333FC724
MLVGLTKGDKAAEAGKTSDQSENYDVKSVIRAASCAWYAIHCLLVLYGEEKEKLCYPLRLTPRFTSFKNRIDEVEKDNSSTKDSAIIKFCRSIAENDKLYKELENLNNLAENFANKEFDSQLEKIITGFKLKNLEDKVGFLILLKEESNFTAIQEAYSDKWSFYDLIHDRDFKQTYIDKAVTESANKSFKEDIDKCIKLAEQGKKAASKYFEGKGVELRAYYTETDNAHRVLNINLINYNRSEPTKISDILQQEKDIKELNIYCNKKHEIHAHQEGKKRYYEFKEGACYEMTSTWPVENGSRMCTMIMNVSSDGITEILKFDGEDFVPLEEILELIKQNDELYIQGLSLHDAVMKLLEKGKAADVVPTANNNLQNEFIRINQDKEPGGKLDPKVDADNSLPPSINSNASTQTEVNLQQIAIQTEINSQQTETQTEVNLQHTKTQTEVASQQIETQTEVNLQRTGTQTEIDSQQTETQTELSLQEVAIQTEVDLQHTETQTEVASQHIGIQTEINSQQITDLQSESEKAKQRIEELEKQNSDLQDGFRKKEQKNTELQTELAQKNEELASALAELQGKAQELKSVCEENRKLRQELEVVNAKKEELKSELKELKKGLSQVQKEKSDLEDKFDQLERSNKEMNGNQERLSEQVLGLQKELSELKKENQALSNKLESAQTEKKRANQELAEAEQRTEALEKQISDLQDKLEEKERGSKAKIDAMRKELTQLKENLEEKEEEFKSVYEEKRRLEDKLKIVNAEKKESEDELKKFEEGIDQVVRIMEEKEQFISNLKRQMLGLENEYKAQLESMDREHEDEIKELEENCDALSDIIAGKVLDIEGLMKKLQNSEKEKEFFRGQVEELSEETFADKQKGFKNQFYTLTRSLSFDSESDNESYVPLEEERKSLRSSSIDDGYGSDKENCDNDLSSNISPISSIEKVAKSRNVEVA